jgi:hypothetical protein
MSGPGQTALNVRPKLPMLRVCPHPHRPDILPSPQRPFRSDRPTAPHYCSPRRTPSIVPGKDVDTCLVIDDLGRLGLIYCESDVETANVENVIEDLLDGQYSNPVRVICFNVAEGWSLDISADVAAELADAVICRSATCRPAFSILSIGIMRVNRDSSLWRCSQTPLGRDREGRSRRFRSGHRHSAGVWGIEPDSAFAA